MQYLKQAFAAMTFLATFALLVSEIQGADSIVFAQSTDDQSSAASSTVCFNDQPCQTVICTENQPCSSSQTPNIEDPYEDYLDSAEDVMDNDYE